MANKIKVVKNGLSAKTLDRSRGHAKTALKTLDSVASGRSGSLAYAKYAVNGQRFGTFSGEAIGAVSEAFLKLDAINDKLERLAEILGTGPDDIERIDDKYKNDLTSWGDRLNYNMTHWIGKDNYVDAPYVTGTSSVVGTAEIICRDEDKDKYIEKKKKKEKGTIEQETVESKKNNLPSYYTDGSRTYSKEMERDTKLSEEEQANILMINPMSLETNSADGGTRSIYRWNDPDTENMLSCTFYTLRRLRERGLDYPFQRSGETRQGGNWFKNTASEMEDYKAAGDNCLEELLEKHGGKNRIIENIVVDKFNHVVLLDKVYKDENDIIWVEFSDMSTFRWTIIEEGTKTNAGKYIADDTATNPTYRVTLEKFKTEYTTEYTEHLYGAVLIGPGKN